MPRNDEAEHGTRAVELIDAALAARPEKDDSALSAAIDAICACRQNMITRRDAGDWNGDAEGELGTLNGVLSLVLAAEFPLGKVRWDELEGARTALADMVKVSARG